jgi:hypothetical protein
MAIHSRPFGSTILTGDDAWAFERQINGQASVLAQQTLRRGDALLERSKAHAPPRVMRAVDPWDEIVRLRQRIKVLERELVVARATPREAGTR